MAPRLGERCAGTPSLAVLLTVALVGWRPTASQAGAPPEPGKSVHVRYQAPSGCPALEEITARLLARAPSARLVPAMMAERVFAIEISAVGYGYLGTLAVYRGDQVSSRQLSASRCDDLATALALVAALAIERDGPVTPGAAVEVHRPPAPEPRTGPPWTAAVGAGSGVVVGAAPGPMWVAAIDGRLVRDGTGQIALAVALGRDHAELESGEVVFTLAAARIAACWSLWSRGVEADTCAHIEVGGLRAGGRDIVNARDVGRFWLAAGAHGAVRWPPRTQFFGELQLGLSIPLIRDQFYFDPAVMVHQASWATPWALLGAGARFR